MAATAGQHFTPVSGTLTFAPNQVSRSFTIHILQDTVAGPNKTVGLLLSNPTGGASLGTPSSAILTIIDDDAAGTVKLATAWYSVSQADGTLTILVARDRATSSGATIDYATADGTAQSGHEYVATSGTLTFGLKELTKTITIPISQDAVVNGVASFSLTLINPGGGLTLGAPAAATVWIVGNH